MVGRLLLAFVYIVFFLSSTTCTLLEEENHKNQSSFQSTNKDSLKKDSNNRKREEKVKSDSIIKMEPEKIELKCMNYTRMEKKLKIHNNEQYQSLLSMKVNVKQCKNYQLPEIDFSNKLLLGRKTNVAGCQSPLYKREVYYNKNTNIISYRIEIKQNENCKKAWINMNWVVIDQPNESYSIDYSVTKTQAK